MPMQILCIYGMSKRRAINAEITARADVYTYLNENFVLYRDVYGNARYFIIVALIPKCFDVHRCLVCIARGRISDTRQKKLLQHILQPLSNFNRTINQRRYQVSPSISILHSLENNLPMIIIIIRQCYLLYYVKYEKSSQPN